MLYFTVNRKVAQCYLSISRKDDSCYSKESEHLNALFLGEQLVYQLPSNRVLTTKIGLLNSLREYERVSSKVNHGQGPRLYVSKERYNSYFVCKMFSYVTITWQQSGTIMEVQ